MAVHGGLKTKSGKFVKVKNPGARKAILNSRKYRKSKAK